MVFSNVFLKLAPISFVLLTVKYLPISGNVLVSMGSSTKREEGRGDRRWRKL